jgi:eukaryotic-like serine/threonine-protein kinase
MPRPPFADVLAPLYGERYRLMERLGAGGMATVHRAHDEWLKRDVAIKVIARGFRQDVVALRRFRREAELGAPLTHPNIVSVLGAGAEPHDFIVMELVRGHDVRELLRERGRQPLEAVLDVLAQIAAGLEYTHCRGVVHGDVSPGNILIGEEGGTAKLADFGVARAREDTSADRREHALGTPGYIAPEILAGSAPSPSSDLYSLAAVAYSLLTGRTLARSRDRSATARATLADLRPAPLASVQPGLPRTVTGAIQQAMSLDPAARHPSVYEFRGELAGDELSAAPLQAAA